MFIMRIKDLQAHTILGIFDWEKTAPRLVILNIELLIDTPKAPTTDHIDDAVDYAAIETRILDQLEKTSYQLIERLVTDIARLILSLDSRILKVIVEADKPGALQKSRSVSLSCELTRP